MLMQQIFLKLLLVVALNSCNNPAPNQAKMTETNQAQDRQMLSQLNAQFIKNYVTQDVKAHAEIIHEDFVCIENSGKIIGRDEYLKNWASDYQNSGVDSFTYTDEHIRIFGNVALVRSKSVYTYQQNGKSLTGYSVYTDTYLKEDGQWRCVQAHMTPVK